MAEALATEKVVRIGGATASFSDTALSVPQLLAKGKLDYLIFDYLAEGSMGIFGRMQAADPAAGYGTDFLTVHVGPHLSEIAAQGIKVVANAGGVNPAGLAAALEDLIAENGLDLTVAYVAGDDLRGREAELRAAGHRDMFTGADFPDGVLSSNAYLGAFPIAAALGAGADIVITGRVVDSAVVLGPLLHEFGWQADDWDLLAAGTLAGHVLECGAQVTGGTFTDWRDVPDWANIGYPVGECRADGTFIVTKPDGTGGLVSIGTVAEQILYEVSDPADYIVADVRCDFSNVTLKQVAPNRVLVSGARGRPATDSYKACVTFDAGWRAIAYQPIIGEDAAEKAARQAEALFSRSRTLLRARNLPDFSRTDTVLIGGEASFGAHANPAGSREVISKLVVDHPNQEGAGIFARDLAQRAMDVDQARAADQALVGDPAELLGEDFQDADFLRRARREADMAAFGFQRIAAAMAQDQATDAQPGTRADHRVVARLARLARHPRRAAHLVAHPPKRHRCCWRLLQLAAAAAVAVAAALRAAAARLPASAVRMKLRIDCRMFMVAPILAGHCKELLYKEPTPGGLPAPGPADYRAGPATAGCRPLDP